MANQKPRLNVTMDPVEEKFLAQLAKKERKSVSSLIRELVLEALERREDVALSALANVRLAESKETVAHEDVWNELLEKKS